MKSEKIIAEIERCWPRLQAGEGIDGDLAQAVVELPGPEIFSLLPWCNRLRRHHCGRRIALCAIANAKSGRCGENCAFCAQSAAYDTGVETFPLISVEELLSRARTARAAGVENFSVVTSGTAVSQPAEQARIAAMLEGLAGMGLGPCASLGFLDAEAVALYRRAGLKHYHHNLESARSFFPSICTSHAYDRAVETVKMAKAAGFYVCSGGIMGLGESPAQRVELALELRQLEVDSIPLNFLQPVPGTPLADQPGLGPLAGLLTIAMFRLVNPARDIRICGGRQRTFGDFQSLLFAAGATGLMVGNYLTTRGRQWDDDRRLLAEWAEFDGVDG
jgi:biotin synthase